MVVRLVCTPWLLCRSPGCSFCILSTLSLFIATHSGILSVKAPTCMEDAHSHTHKKNPKRIYDDVLCSFELYIIYTIRIRIIQIAHSNSLLSKENCCNALVVKLGHCFQVFFIFAYSSSSTYYFALIFFLSLSLFKRK